MDHNELNKCLIYVSKNLLVNLDKAMIGLSNAPKESITQQVIPKTMTGGSVADELKTFEKDCM